MAKVEVTGLRELWWVWLGEERAVAVASQADALDRLLKAGRGYREENSFGRSDQAAAVVEIQWDRPIRGQTHKTIVGPVFWVLWRGRPRAVLEKFRRREVQRLTRQWEAQPTVPRWWPDQYEAALADPDVLKLRGSRPVIEQLEAHWPEPTALGCLAGSSSLEDQTGVTP